MSVAERVRDKLSRYDDPEVPRIVEHLRARYDDALAAVIFYGSLLSAETRTPTSFYDFYLLTDQPWRFYRGPFQAALSYVLPPNVYYERIAAGPRFKTCAMSLAQLAVETSPAAHDLHHLGRFSKRFALVYARDAATRDAVVDAAIAAMRTVLDLTLARLAAHARELELDEVIVNTLALSYLGERRVAEPRKVSGLFAGERAYYREVYAALLAERDDVSPLGGGRVALPPADSHANARAERFIARSRRRGVMRWPKYLLTVDGWLEIQLEKLERHHGIALQLDERTRRWPLIFGWPKFFELVRRGVIK